MSNGVSINPKDASAGGMLDGATVLIKTVRAINEYPNGVKAPLLSVTYEMIEGDKKERREIYSAGKVALVASADGKMFVAAVDGNGAKPAKDSGMIKFFLALITAGFPADKINNDVTDIEGTVVFLRAKAQPKWGEQKEEKILFLPERVVSLPGEKPAPAAKAAPKAAPKAAAKAAPAAAPVAAPATPPPAAAATATATTDDELVAKVEGIVSAILSASDKSDPLYSVPRNRIGNEVFQSCAKNKVPGPERTKIMALINADKGAFFEDGARPWYIDAEKNAVVGVPAEEEVAA